MVRFLRSSIKIRTIGGPNSHPWEIGPYMLYKRSSCFFYGKGPPAEKSIKIILILLKPFLCTFTYLVVMKLYPHGGSVGSWTLIFLLIKVTNQSPMTYKFIKDIIKKSNDWFHYDPSETGIMKYEKDHKEAWRSGDQKWKEIGSEVIRYGENEIMKYDFQNWKALGSELIRYGKTKLQVEDIEEARIDSCKSKPSLRILKYLGRICEDCYNLFREIEVITMCR